MQEYEGTLTDDSPDAVLYQRYAPSIFAYLYRQTTSREDAEDLLLEVFLAVLEQQHFSARGEQEQQVWLWRVTRNKVADYFRRFSRRPSVPLNRVAETIDENDDVAPEQATLKQEEYAQLHSALHELSELQQEVLLLRFGHGLSCAEIAPVLEKSEAAVRMLLSRTLKLLRGVYLKQENRRL